MGKTGASYPLHHRIRQLGGAPQLVTIVLLAVKRLDQHRTQSNLLLLLLLRARHHVLQRHLLLVIVLVFVGLLVAALARHIGRRLAAARDARRLVVCPVVGLATRLGLAPAPLACSSTDTAGCPAHRAAADVRHGVDRGRTRVRRARLGGERCLPQRVHGHGRLRERRRLATLQGGRLAGRVEARRALLVGNLRGRGVGRRHGRRRGRVRRRGHVVCSSG